MDKRIYFSMQKLWQERKNKYDCAKSNKMILY
ncbi:hypothetical protein MSROBK_003840 [Spiroplasma poulsonii]|nr:hypothetical protein MSROBK_003840 [Spiroplasma poulsonii]PWF95552.1 hypothetical protein SMSE_09870 [Spiroplasma poulsonii]PWF98333.1 hypothetical protein SMH99_08930 [Spiroplasma poulsonii]